MESVVRIHHRLGQSLCLLLAVLCLGTFTVEAQAKIHAQKGFRYKLTEKHGPWMIMVAVFSQPPAERRAKEGMTPQQAADELVYELRLKGVPAYTFTPHEAGDKIQVVKNKEEELMADNQFAHLVEEGSICVLAGNFDIMGSEKDKTTADKTLAWIKDFTPEFLNAETQLEVSAPLNPALSRQNPRQGGVFQKLKNGGVFATTPGNPGPLSGAFLTINPLVSAEQLNESKRNRYLVDLNSDGDFSLLDCEGKYTLIVATFYGNSKTQALNTDGAFQEENDSQNLGTSLDASAFKAWEFCKALRTAKNYGYDENYEAYVLHTRYKSYVTIGSFDDANDPRIAELKQLMGAKVHQTAGNSNSTFAEMFSIPRNPGPGQVPLKSWIFDPEPQLSQVPHIK